MKNLKEEVLKMSAKEIILTMVESLRHPSIKIDMDSFGQYNNEGVCFGCASTNFICKVTEYTFTESDITGTLARSAAINEDLNFLGSFEIAIDNLRSGHVEDYNHFATKIGIAEIKEVEDIILPDLNDDYTEEELLVYVELANAQ